MSPSQFHKDYQARREINGSRPIPLKINQESHLIHKPPSSSSSSSTSSSCLSIAAAVTKQSQNQQRQPVIIYTHSPKIIHTQASDFMALVQKLTGLSRSEDPAPQSQPSEGGNTSSDGCSGPRIIGHDDGTSSSAITDEKCGGGDVGASSTSVSSLFAMPNLSEIPLFTPNPTDFFCSSRPFFRYPDSIFSPPNMGKSISPPVLEAMKAFPEY
ncbi:VQ motif-containing protein 8, chloroplastic-like [Magnolia sinica]|uniref:VQ motif-containing protein 8, chloroplastic-like n=1 Tax=Magnolia sinica TaxID=86752 RepID=UPI0026599D4A|nr:VQ motif-containing protein 8, chloroplastic-like [Magnolia sinica]